jgi:hypothetical protein
MILSMGVLLLAGPDFPEVELEVDVNQYEPNFKERAFTSNSLPSRT